MQQLRNRLSENCTSWRSINASFNNLLNLLAWFEYSEVAEHLKSKEERSPLIR